MQKNYDFYKKSRCINVIEGNLQFIFGSSKKFQRDSINSSVFSKPVNLSLFVKLAASKVSLKSSAAITIYISIYYILVVVDIFMKVFFN